MNQTPINSHKVSKEKEYPHQPTTKSAIMSIVSNKKNQHEEPNYISDCDSEVQDTAASTASAPETSSFTAGSSTRSTSNFARVGRIRLKVRKEIQSRLEATGSLCPGASTARCAKRLEEILFSVHMKNNQKNGGSTPPSIDEYYAGSMRGRIKPLLVVLLERKLRTHKQELIQSSKSHHAQEATR